MTMPGKTNQETSMTTTPDPAFYSLPAYRLTKGMSTNDGQDIIKVWYARERGLVGYTTYTPRPDDPDLDDYNRSMTDTRIARWNELVDLAVFIDTEVDGRKEA